MNPEVLRSTCCVVGGGPAGIMLGYLLARSGVKVTILEKHGDFFRDFRGDTVHPSTLQVMEELGLLDELLEVPHQKVTSVRASFGGSSVEVANLKGLKTRCPYVALMPQWDFLNFLSNKGKEYSGFDLRMQHEVSDLIWRNNRIAGVMARTPDGVQRFEANLVIGCDGRRSVVRAAAALPLEELGVPIDVLWFRITRNEFDREEQQVVGNVNYGKVLILLDRGNYFQAGLIIQKGSFARVKSEGLHAFRAGIARMAPHLDARVKELENWEQIQLLSVQINRLRRWHRPGLLCIGDAAHAMSPAFGVGINLAIQDAVATANLLADSLAESRSCDDILHQVQRRRQFPTRVTQFLQVIAHKGMSRVFAKPGPMRPPLLVKVIVSIPGFQRTFARVIGIGVRPEHVTPKLLRPRAEIGPVQRTVALCAGVATAATVMWRRTFAA